MSLSTAHAALKSILLADAALGAWATTHFSKALTALDGNRELRLFNSAELPAVVFDIGDGTSQSLESNRFTNIGQQINFGFVWLKDDMAAAFAARVALLEPVVQCVLRNNTLNATVSRAVVSSWNFAQGVDDPHIHSARFVLDIDYGLTI
jgi:hypothetical protein